MIRVMFDSTTASAIPADATLVAGYIDGDYAWTPADWDRFPGAALVKINVTGVPEHGGDMLDVENGAATPADAPVWWEGQARKTNLGVYVNRSNLGAVENAMGTRPWWRWVATLDGTLFVPVAGWVPFQRPAAVQFASAQLSGIHADVSLVYADEFHPQPSLAKIAANAHSAITEASSLLQLMGKYAA
jgi:hypothetical protein